MGDLRLTPAQNRNQSGASGYGSVVGMTGSPLNGRLAETLFPGDFVGALMGVSAVNVRTNVIPSYHMRSLGRFQSFSPGLRDGGDVSAAVNWLPGANDTQSRFGSNISLLRQAYETSNDLVRVRVLGPDPDFHMWYFDGFLTQLGPFSYQPEAIMSGQVGWKIVGRPELVTPLVYAISGTINNATVATAEAAQPFTVAASAISGASANENGAPAVINVRGQNYSVVANSKVNSLAATLPVLSYTAPVHGSGSEAAGKLSLTIATPTLPATTDSAPSSKRLWARLYVPGEFELWFDQATAGAVTDLATGVPTSSSDRGTATDADTFIERYIGAGNRAFLVIYGNENQVL